MTRVGPCPHQAHLLEREIDQVIYVFSITGSDVGVLYLRL